jgi:hypothetical protein
MHGFRKRRMTHTLTMRESILLAGVRVAEGD